VFIAGGTHYIGPPSFTAGPGLLVGSNTHLKMGHSTVLVRRIHAPDDPDYSTIRNKGHAGAGNVNIRVSGGSITYDPSQDCRGNHIGFNKVDGVAVENVRFLGVFNYWNMAFIQSQNILVSGIFMDSGDSLEEDGIHVTSCQRFVLADSIIICGDDCLAFTQEAAADMGDTTDAVVSNCYFWSRQANALKLLVTTAGNGHAIRRVRVNNIVAKVGMNATVIGAGIHIEDQNAGQYQVSDVEIDGFWLDSQFSKSEDGTRLVGVRRVRLQKLVLSSPWGPVTINGCQDIELRDCVVDTPRKNITTPLPDPPLPPAPCVAVAQTANCTNIRLLGGRYIGAKTHGVIWGSTDFSVTRFEVSNAQITGSNFAGMYIPKATDGIVSGNTITGSGAWGIEETNQSSRNLFIGNWLQANNPLNQNAGAILSSGQSSEVVRNVNTPSFTLNDSGGYRQTIDGWIRDNVPSDLPDEEMPRNNFAVVPGSGAGRFRAARSGSVTGLVVTSTVAAAGGPLTVTLWKNDSGVAGGGGGAQAFTATLAVGQTQVTVTKPQGQISFVPGAELFLKVSTTSDWEATTADIRCAIEIED
jgi:hypothetical protein